MSCSDEKVSLIDNPDKLYQYISDCLKPKEVEKKQFGEVFTPMSLVNEMLDKLPNEVWYNSKLKWYDPAVGMGNFPIAVYLRLLETLKNEISDEGCRKKHIIENMLYMSELNKNNVMVCKQIFNINNDYKMNIHEGDSLEIKVEEEFNVDKFDVIVGNPPYQKENKKNTSARGGTNNNLYLDFVKNSIKNLNKDGYLLFIHPLNWRKIGSKIFDEFINRNIYFLKLNYGKDFFKNVSVKTDYYILKNSNEKNYNTKIEYIYPEKGSTGPGPSNKKTYSSDVILSKSLKFIPNIFNEQVNSILEKINLHGVEYECVISSDCHKTRSHVKKGKNATYKYPLFNTSGNPYDYFSSKAHKYQYNKKIILSNSGKLEPFYDDGVLGTTQDSMFILVDSKKEGDLLIKSINSKLFKFLIQICQWGNFRNEASLFSYLKYPTSDINSINDEFIYAYYKLNNNEISLIENVKDFLETGAGESQLRCSGATPYRNEVRQSCCPDNTSENSSVKKVYNSHIVWEESDDESDKKY